MKILHLTDYHWSMVSPRSRKDNYFETCVAKSEVILNIVKNEKVDVVTFVGDLFHHKEPSRVPYRLTDTIRNWIHLITESGAKFLWIWGNHDKQSDNKDLFDRQPIYNIMFPPIPNKDIVHLDDFGFPYSTNIDDKTLFIGYDHTYAFDTPEFDFSLWANQVRSLCHSEKYKDFYKVLLLHQAIHPSNLNYPFFTRKLNLFENLGVDLLLGGHIHEDFGVIQTDSGMYFVNTGSITRGSAHEYNLHRVPNVALINYSGAGTPVFKVYPLTNLKSEDVFDVDLIQYTKDLKSRMEVFATSLSKEGNDDSSIHIDTSVLSNKELPLYESYLNTGNSKQKDRRDMISSLYKTELFSNG